MYTYILLTISIFSDSTCLEYDDQTAQENGGCGASQSSLILASYAAPTTIQDRYMIESDKIYRLFNVYMLKF